MYRDGQGVPQNFAEAVVWFDISAKQGLAMAQNNLGVMYNGGQGVVQDYADAVGWYRKAAEQGFLEAQYNLALNYSRGQGVLKNYVEAYKWFSLAAAAGDVESVKNRGIAANLMTSAELAEAQKLVREWRPKKTQWTYPKGHWGQIN